MTKNILDTILDEEEPVKSSSFIVAKKVEPEIKKERVEEIKLKNPDFVLAKTDELLTSEPSLPSPTTAPTRKSNLGKIYKKHKPTKREKTASPVVEKISKKRKLEMENEIEISLPDDPLWLSVSEAAKIGGVEQKTIRRAIQSEKVKFKIINDRYLIEFSSMVKYLYSNTKLRNKFLDYGVGQYVERWI